jgi:hypothetical protein
MSKSASPLPDTFTERDGREYEQVIRNKRWVLLKKTVNERITFEVTYVFNHGGREYVADLEGNELRGFEFFDEDAGIRAFLKLRHGNIDD